MKNFKIIILLLSVVFTVPVMAQQTRTVTGVVYDENNQPVIGAIIKLTDSTGTVTNTDGRFTLSKIPADKQNIQVTCVGYLSQAVDITTLSEVKVDLVPSVKDLGEVVVVGYGSQKRAHLTGSVATVTPSDISDLSSTSLAKSLGGMVAGVSVNTTSNRPGETSHIVIRNNDLAPGAMSNSASLMVPLYVIDDYVYPREDGEAAFNNLEVSMIESISILKDAAAAVYGARSGMGVILVKTKRGKAGKPKISYSGQYGYADEFYRSKMMDSYNYGKTWNAIRMADPTQGDVDPKKVLFQADELETMKGLNYDLLDKHWTSALTQKHSLNVSGGNEIATYFGGVSYNTQDGNLGRITYDRWNYRAGMDAKINKWTKASLQVSGDYGNKTKSFVKVGGSNDEKDYVILLTRPRYIPEYVTDPSGKSLPIAAYGITNNSIEGSQNYNHDVLDNLDNFSKSMPQNMLINSAVEYDFGWNKILKGLKIKATYSKSISTTKNNQYGSSYTLYQFTDGSSGRGGSGNHLYTGTEGYPLNFSNITKVPVENGNFLLRNMNRTDGYQLNFISTYARSFGKHDVSGLFTIEKSERETENIEGKVTLPLSFTNLQSNGASGDQTTNFSRQESGALSYVGRLNYAYDNKYLAEFLVRSDASTTFAPENYWGIFPSLSLGWVLSEESWFKDKISFINFLKLRGSYGLSGRANVPNWAWLQTYGSETGKGPIFGSNPSLVAGSHYQLPSAIPNRNSHWDNIYKSNGGLDIKVLKSRLSLTLDGYYDKGRDVFMSISNSPDYPGTVGALASASNYGSIDNYGIEVSLGWRDKIGKDFNYHLSVNTGFNDNKIIKYPWVDASTRGLEDLVPNERADRGVWGYECIGMFRSNQDVAEYFAEKNLTTYMGKTQADVHPGMLIYNDVRGSQKADGSYYAPGDVNDPAGNKVDANDRIQISKRSNNIYGFTLNFGGEYKNFSFSGQFGASWGSYTMMPTEAISNKSIFSSTSGYDVMQYTNLPSFWSGNMFVYEDVRDAQGRVVAEQNLNAKYPNLRYAGVNSVASTFWRVNNANVMLRNLTLAYNLPKALVNKAGIESCRINITGQNLLEFYNPYPDKFMSPNSPYSTYPTLRTITMGLNVSF